MGFFSSIGNAISKVGSTVLNKVIAPTLDFTTVALVHPLQTAVAIVSPKSTIAQVEQAHFSQPLSKQIQETVVSTVAIGATVLTAGTSTGLNIAKTVGISLIPKSVLGKVAAGGALTLAAPVIAAQVIKNPEGTAKVIENIPQNIFQTEKDLFNISSKPTIEGAIEFLRSHPYLTATTALAALIGAGFGALGLANIISNYYNTEAIKDNTKAADQNPINLNIPENKNTTLPPNIQIINQIPLPQQSEIPQVPAVAAPLLEGAPAGVVVKKTTKKKKKAKKKVKKKTRRSKKKKKKTIKRKKH